MKAVNRALNGFMAALFLILAALQYTNLNPVGWMALYIAFAVPCVLAVQGKLTWRVPAIVTAVGLLWLGNLGVSGALHSGLSPEMLASVVGTVWMICLTVLTFRGRLAGVPAFQSQARSMACR